MTATPRNNRGARLGRPPLVARSQSLGSNGRWSLSTAGPAAVASATGGLSSTVTEGSVGGARRSQGSVSNRSAKAVGTESVVADELSAPAIAGASISSFVLADSGAPHRKHCVSEALLIA